MSNKIGFSNVKKETKSGWFSDWQGAPKKSRSYGRTTKGLAGLGTAIGVAAAAMAILNNKGKKK